MFVELTRGWQMSVSTDETFSLILLYCEMPVQHQASCAQPWDLTLKWHNKNQNTVNKIFCEKEVEKIYSHNKISQQKLSKQEHLNVHNMRIKSSSKRRLKTSIWTRIHLDLTDQHRSLGNTSYHRFVAHTHRTSFLWAGILFRTPSTVILFTLCLRHCLIPRAQ